MAKTMVKGTDEDQSNIPFLRGILTRSLQAAGLTFEEAYAMASAVRDDLADTSNISAEDLRRRVAKRLTKTHGAGVVQRYESAGIMPQTVIVRDSTGGTSPFSREQHRRMLESSGLTYENSGAVTTRIFDHLMKKGRPEISSRYLGYLTYRYLQRSLGAEEARRYLVLVDFFRGAQPLMLLIGGAPGSGKSFVATELAHRLEIVRTQSTDLLREVMRMMIPKRLSPVLHASSFNSWQVLPGRPDHADDSDAAIVEGYKAQAELLSVPCEAVIQRAANEQVSLVLEGVHVETALLKRAQLNSAATIVPMIVAVLNRNRLKERIRGRGKQADQRRAERYLGHFDAIWRLQSFLLDEADRSGIPIIENNHRDQVVQDAMRVVVDALSTDFTLGPADVFI